MQNITATGGFDAGSTRPGDGPPRGGIDSTRRDQPLWPFPFRGQSWDLFEELDAKAV